MLGLVALLCFAQLPADPASLSAHLQSLQARTPEFGARVAVLASQQLGTPYFDGPLGEGPEGTVDTDPLIDLARVDCVTFVEQTLALAASPDYEHAFATLQRLRYRDGEVSFNARNHFMVSDWLANNAAWCREVTADLGVPTAKVTRTISRKGFFERVQAPDEYRGEPDREVTLTYIPREQVAAAVEKLPSPALIVFIGQVDWLFALHCGFFVRDDDGNGTLIHASSKAKAVTRQSLTDYLAEQPRYLGFTAYQLAPGDSE